MTDDTPTREEVDAFITSMDDQLHHMFDSTWSAEVPGSGIPESELRERVAFYLTSRGQINLRKAGRQRPVKYVVGESAKTPEEAAALAEKQEQQRQHALQELSGEDDSEEAQRRARQRARRSEAVNQLFMSLLTRQEPSPNVRFVTMAELVHLMEEYKQARAEGYLDKDLDFLPLSAYQSKIFPPNRKPIRQLFENECGVFQMASNPASPLAGRIVCVRDRDLGTGTGLGNWSSSHVVVPDTIAPSNPKPEFPGLLPGPEKQ